MNSRAFLAAAFAFGLSSAAAQTVPKCSDPAVAAELAKLLKDQICLAADISLQSLTLFTTIDEPVVKLEKGLTTAESTAPPRRDCHADLSWDAKAEAAMLGPEKGTILHLRVTGEPRGVNYSLALYDDGSIYLTLPLGSPCWQATTIETLDAPR